MVQIVDRNFSCSGNNPCHHGLVHVLWSQMFQWRKTHFLPCALSRHPSRLAQFSQHEFLNTIRSNCLFHQCIRVTISLITIYIRVPF